MNKMNNPQKSKNLTIDKTSEIKHAVVNKDISLVNLFKYSYRLFLIESKKLIILEAIYAIVLSIYYILGSPADYHLSFNIVLYNIIVMIVTAFGIVVLTSAVSDLYERGRFRFKEVLTRGISKFFKYLWTQILIILFFFFILIILIFFTGILYAIGIPRVFPLLIWYITVPIFFIWAIVPLYFMNYIVVCNDYYGVKGIRILFRIVGGRRWQLLWYEFITIIFFVPFIPVFYLTIKGFRIAFLMNIPLSVIWLYIRLYGLVLYKHLVSKFGENNLGSFDIYDKWDTIVAFDKMIRITPNDAKLYNSRGYTYLDLERYKEAIEDFNKVIELGKEYKDTYVGLAIVYYRTGDKKKSIENYKMAIKLDKRYKRNLDELKKEGYSYTAQNLKTINEILKEMNKK